MNLPTSILHAPYTYKPPEGYYDLPCHWVFNAEGLGIPSGGIAAIQLLNQSIPISRGFGDFYLRRIVGMAGVLWFRGGQFQLKNGLGLDYMSSAPMYVVTNDDIAFAIEEIYPETGAIRFDLYNCHKQSAAAQIVFMGVGRHKGSNPLEAQFGNQPFEPVTQIYTQTAVIPTATTTGVPVSVIQKVINYHFDLLKIELLYTNPGTLNSVCAMMLFDGARQQISNLPINDAYWNGIANQPPTSLANPYGNGAVVPPLFYPQNSNIRLDLTPLAIGALGNVTITVNFVGRNRIPL